MKTLEYYKGIKYPIELIETEDGVVVSHPDLPGCQSFGETIPEAVRNLDEVRSLWLEGHFKRYRTAPEPRDDEDYSGKFVLRVPKWLHRALEKTAGREGVSLNQLVVSLLSKAVGDRTSEALSLRVCEALDQMGKVAAFCGAQRFFVKNFRVPPKTQYSVHCFAKNRPAFELQNQQAPPLSAAPFPGDEEALDFVYNALPGNFESKFQMSGKRR